MLVKVEECVGENGGTGVEKCFFFQAEDGIRDRDGWLEFRRVLFRSASIQAAEPECEDAALSGDEEYDEYFTYVMEQQDLSFPCNQDDGIQLYETLYAAINR